MKLALVALKHIHTKIRKQVKSILSFLLSHDLCNKTSWPKNSYISTKGEVQGKSNNFLYHHILI